MDYQNFSKLQPKREITEKESLRSVLNETRAYNARLLDDLVATRAEVARLREALDDKQDQLNRSGVELANEINRLRDLLDEAHR